MALATTCLWESLDDIKPWCKLSSSDVKDDVVIETLANSITEELERLTARVFVSRSMTQTFDSVNHSAFILRGYPVTVPLTTFTIDGTAVESDAFSVDATGGLVRLHSGPRSSSVGIDNVVITYTAGYARASLPATVLQVGAEMVAFRYADWCAGANAASSAQFGTQGYVPRSSWPYHIKDAIAALRYEVRGPVLA